MVSWQGYVETDSQTLLVEMQIGTTVMEGYLAVTSIIHIRVPLMQQSYIHEFISGLYTPTYII